MPGLGVKRCYFRRICARIGPDEFEAMHCRRTVAEPGDRSPAADVDFVPQKGSLRAPHVVHDRREHLPGRIGPALRVWHSALGCAGAHRLRPSAGLRRGGQRDKFCPTLSLDFEDSHASGILMF